MRVNNLPKVATQWNRGATQDSNPGHRARIPSALTTRPLRYNGPLSYNVAFIIGSDSGWHSCADRHPVKYTVEYVQTALTVTVTVTVIVTVTLTLTVKVTCSVTGTPRHVGQQLTSSCHHIHAVSFIFEVSEVLLRRFHNSAYILHRQSQVSK